MTYKGHVENGVVVLDDPVVLENGEPVAVATLGRNANVEPDAEWAERRRRYAELRRRREEWKKEPLEDAEELDAIMEAVLRETAPRHFPND